MYVTKHGVKKEKERPSQQIDPWGKPMGQSASSPRSLSRIQLAVSRINGFMSAVIIAVLVVSTGLTMVITDYAEAARPNVAIKSFGAAQELGVPSVPTKDEAIAIASAQPVEGYWIATKRGEVFPFGEAEDFGGLPEGERNDVVDIASTPSGKGYWLLAETGAVYTYGDAQYFGGVESSPEDENKFVSLVPTRSGQGYLLVDNKGNVVVFGDGENFGRAGILQEGEEIVDAVLSYDGEGYLMVSQFGSVFVFGNTRFHGAAHPGMLSAPATAISPTSDGEGYWILAQDGGVFTFGDANFFGSAVPDGEKLPSIDIAIYGNGEGYWIAKGKSNEVTQVKNTDGPAPVRVAGERVERAGDDVWAALRNCEAGGNYATNTGNGYYGAYQFHKRTWDSMNTGYEWPHEAPPEVQDDAARRLQERSGWGQWPACSRKIGVR